MSCYTLCDCLLSNIDLDKKYIGDVLFVFIQSNAFKVTLDKSNKIIEIYKNIAEKDHNIYNWLDLMTKKPSSFEIINIDVSKDQDKDEIFLKVCSSTKSQQKAIVYSHERWNRYKGKVIIYNSIPVTVYDKDEAVIELNPPSSNTTINAIKSTVATGRSKIKDSKNLNK